MVENFDHFWSFWGVFDPLKKISSNYLFVISEWVEFPNIPQIFKFFRRREHTQLLTSVRRIKKKLDDGTPLAFLNIQDAMGFNSILELMLVKLAGHGPLHGHHVSQLVGTL